MRSRTAIALSVLLIALVGTVVGLSVSRFLEGSTETATSSISTSHHSTSTSTSSSTQKTSGTGTTAQHSIGYVGCSNTADAVQGYYMVQNKQRIWQSYSTGGGSLDKWAAPGSTYWSLFDQQVQRYGQPSGVWIQICELATRPLTFGDVQQAVANLKQHVSTAVFYISQLNAYSPTNICALTGPNGVADSASLVNQTVSSGLALRGPILGPLTTQNTVSDMCHPNSVGEQLLGSQLVSFFDH